MENIKIFCSQKDIPFAKKICKQTKIPLGLCQTKHFPSGEILFQINEEVKESHVVFIKRFSKFIHQDIWELLQMVHLAHQMQAKSISLVLPYLPYTRQHRHPISFEFSACQLFINAFKNAGADKIITLDMHAPEQSSNFCLPIINISIVPFWIEYLNKLNLKWETISIFGADKSASLRAKLIAKHFNCTWGHINKKRDSEGNISTQSIEGDCKNKNILLIDDLIDTGNTIRNAALHLKHLGALDITVLATHCLANYRHMKLLDSYPITKIISTDTLPLSVKTFSNFIFEKYSVQTILSKNIANIFDLKI